MFQNGAFTKVSTLAIDNILSEYTNSTISSSFSIAWGQRGQYFVAFVFTDRAFVYNITTKLWHEQKSRLPSGSDYTATRWRVNSLVSAYGYTLVGDNADGRIGKLDNDIYQEYGNDIVRLFSTQLRVGAGKSFRIPVVELTMEAGVGNTDDPNPTVSMSISEDNKVFQYERTRFVGKIGKYGQRTIWRKNGRIPRYATVRFRMSGPYKVVVIKLEVGVV